MKFTVTTSLAIAVAQALLVFSSPAPSELERRFQTPATQCISMGKYPGGYNGDPLAYDAPGASSLLGSCSESVIQGGQDPWTVPACVAFATAKGPTWTIVRLQCTEDMPNATAQPSLDYNVYANIVGACAWDPEGCPITQQNYIDFYYGSLSAIGYTGTWPDANDVINYLWNPITEWTATGDTVPYLNFNDWLHWGVPYTY
ncbi:hypothetical protein BT96DRAFT_922752 [Gymnopus androsaceus JB14]|uniref:Uncharacterized protein n=1 Tax=Gymnopus androsaceus JB14 TaxID=1447944 RepID=A0A6A4HEQ0_9AGAR|nr:hypothetical protein BT96DRAFT_922752 [Gymnopus androsaceus JB14]